MNVEVETLTDSCPATLHNQGQSKSHREHGDSPVAIDTIPSIGDIHSIQRQTQGIWVRLGERVNLPALLRGQLIVGGWQGR